MNTEENNLEGDAVWDKMTLDLLDSPSTLTADPDREIVYNKPVNVNGISVLIEDSSKTVWLNKKGEKVIRPEESTIFIGESTTTYRMEIIDFSKPK